MTTKARFRDDKVARRVLRDLEATLKSHVPKGKTLIYTLSAPIKISKRLVAAAAPVLLTATGREKRKLLFGNRLRFFMAKANGRARVIGFVFSGDPKPSELARAMSELKVELKSGERRYEKSKVRKIADLKTYRYMRSKVTGDH